jgi:hypothetical protein
MNIAQKVKWGYVRKLKLSHLLNDNFSSGPTIILFPILPLLRRSITLKHIFES